MSKRLQDKVALVTGGSRGIGKAIALRLAEEGAGVVISYAASAAKAEAVAEEIRAKGVKGEAIRADQANAGEVAKLVSDVAARHGKLDILVNSAGVAAYAMTGDPVTDPTALDRQLAVNLTSIITAVRTAAPLMKEGGRIITIGSNLGQRVGFPGVAEYSGSKAAVAGYTRGWAQDLGPKGITVNVVAPGPIDTDMNPDNTDFAATLKAMTALKRYGKAEEIAAAVAFLASPEASYITGTVLSVDGGINA
jgi:3-oxoacyl-[acyl-carrier protein] reductase